MKKITGTILALLLAVLLTSGCAKEEETVAEKAPSKIDQFNKKNADAMVKKIRSPLDKARMTQGLGEKRMEEMDEALQQNQ